MTTLTNVNFLTGTDSAANQAARRALLNFYFPAEASNDRGDWNARFNTLLPAPMRIEALSRYSHTIPSYDLLNRPYSLLQTTLGGGTLGIVQPSTVFSDAAGTVPQTVFGAGVAALLSQSGVVFGSQATSGQRALYARHPARGLAQRLRNTSTAGAALGVMGSGGAAPTGWIFNFVGGATGTIEVINVQPDFVDVAVNQTNTLGAFLAVFNNASIPAVAGNQRVFTLDAAILSGSVSGVVQLRAAMRDAADVVMVSEAFGANLTLTDTVQRFERSRTHDTVGAALARYDLRTSNITAPYTATFRIGRPQIEDGLTATAYQQSLNNRTDVTEPGQRSVFYLANDLIDDSLPHTLAAGIYTVARMDRTGYSLTENVVHAGGAFGLLGSTSRLYAVHLHNQAGGLLSAAQKAVLQTVFNYAGQGATI